MTRKEFAELVGTGAAVLLLPGRHGTLGSCCTQSSFPAAPINVDFALDISTGTLSSNRGYTISNGIVIACTLSGCFLAVSAASMHEGITVKQKSSKNDFYSPRHRKTFSSSGQVTGGPASKALVTYNTASNGISLQVHF